MGAGELDETEGDSGAGGRSAGGFGAHAASDAQPINSAKRTSRGRQSRAEGMSVSLKIGAILAQAASDRKGLCHAPSRDMGQPPGHTYCRLGPHAGSEASTGVGRRLSLRPVRSTCQMPVWPLSRVVRKNCTTRPLGDQVGASSCQLSVR